MRLHWTAGFWLCYLLDVLSPRRSEARQEATQDRHLQTMKKSLLIIVSAFVLAGCCTSHPVTSFEYREEKNLNTVNQLAEQGWKVVNLSIMQDGPHVYLLQRAKP